MATAVVAGPQRPTISSSARSSSLATAPPPKFQLQSSVAARLAAGNSSRRSTAITATANPTYASSSKTPSLAAANKQQTPAVPQKASILKIPSLSTALVQNGPTSSISTPKVVSIPSSTRPVSSVLVSGPVSVVKQPQPASASRPVSMLVSNASSPRTSPPPPAVPAASVPQRVPATRVASVSIPAAASVHHPPPKMAVTTAGHPVPASSTRLPYQRPKTASSLPHHNQAIRVDDEPVTAVQLIKPTSKETTLGVETNDVESVAVAVQSDEVVVEDGATNTLLSYFDRCEGQAQTRLTGEALELAYNQMLSRFLAMSVVAQELAAKFARSTSKSRKMAEAHEQSEASLKQDFEQIISQMTAEHATASALSKQRHEEEILKIESEFKRKQLETEERLAAEHVQQLRDLETEWNNRLSSAKEEFASQLEAQRQEAERRERELSALACTEEEAVARRVEAETVRFKAAFAENDSLRAVLDLRSGELRTLRAENAQLKFSLEEMPDYKEKILQLEHQIENLEAVLALRRDQERALTERQQELLQRVDEEEAEKRQIWRACEVLVYQLQSAGILPLQAPFHHASSNKSNSLVVETLSSTPTKPSLTPPFTASTPLVPAGCSSRFLISHDDEFGQVHNGSVASIDCCTSPHHQIIEASCSPGTESLLQKIIESSQHHQPIKVSCGHSSGDDKSSSQGVYSDASPRSISSSNTSASPPPQIHPSDDPLHLSSSTSSTSGCYSSNELDELKSSTCD